MSVFATERVLTVRHWNEDYFSFTTTRDDGLCFDNGQFVMIGLEVCVSHVVQVSARTNDRRLNMGMTIGGKS